MDDLYSKSQLKSYTIEEIEISYDDYQKACKPSTTV